MPTEKLPKNYRNIIESFPKIIRKLYEKTVFRIMTRMPVSRSNALRAFRFETTGSAIPTGHTAASAGERAVGAKRCGTKS
jgi:hypothetical protein